MKSINYQLFRTLLRHSFNEAEILEKDWEWEHADCKALEVAIEEMLGFNNITGKSPISVTTIKRHVTKVTIRSTQPRSKTLDIYCKYCFIKKNPWCVKDNWNALLVEAKKGTLDLDRLTKDTDNQSDETASEILINVCGTTTGVSFPQIWRAENEGILEFNWYFREIRFKQTGCPMVKIKASQIIRHDHIEFNEGAKCGSYSKITFKHDISGKRQVFEACMQASAIEKSQPINKFGNKDRLYNAIKQFINICKTNTTF